MIGLVILKKITILFIIMLAGFLLVKLRLVSPDDSKVLSKVCLYLVYPCVAITAFQTEKTPERIYGFVLSLLGGIIAFAVLILAAKILDYFFHLNTVEKASVIYSNSGNLVIPLVSAMFGNEWVIYTLGFTVISNLLFWSHGTSLISGEKNISVKKVLLNVNILATFIGLFLFITGLHLPNLAEEAVESISSVLGPVSMIIIGMIIGGTDLKKIYSNKRAWMIVIIRLVAMPIIIMPILKLSMLQNMTPDGDIILLITMLAVSAPTAVSISQMAQIYGKDDQFACAVNVLSTLLCILTMPLMIIIYEL